VHNPIAPASILSLPWNLVKGLNQRCFASEGDSCTPQPNDFGAELVTDHRLILGALLTRILFTHVASGGKPCTMAPSCGLKDLALFSPARLFLLSGIK
jgi:hypothetical protein